MISELFDLSQKFLIPEPFDLSQKFLISELFDLSQKFLIPELLDLSQIFSQKFVVVSEFKAPSHHDLDGNKTHHVEQ